MTAAPMLSALVPTTPGTRLTVEQTIQGVEENVIVRPRQADIFTGNEASNAPGVATAHLAIPVEQWTSDELRDYVIRQIEAVHGAVPRKAPYIEQAIFKGFCDRHGERAGQVARYAFEVAGGYWHNAPISVTRFCVGSDPYFSAPILEHLLQVEAVRV